MRKVRFRFGIRKLLVGVVVVALALQFVILPAYDWFSLPLYKLNALTHDIERNGSAAELNSFRKSADWEQTMIKHLAGGAEVKSVTPTTELIVAPATLADVLAGRRRATVKHGQVVETIDGQKLYGYSTARIQVTGKGVSGD